jgi:hypothetical protein
MTPGVVDQYLPHHPCSEPKVMGAVLPIDMLAINQPKVSLADQGRSLQGVIGAFAPHEAMRQPV